MIELMKTHEENVVGFRARGNVDEADVRQVVGALDQAFERSDEVALIADLSDWEDMTVKGMLTDISEGVKRAGKLSKLSRVALIGDGAWIDKAASVEDTVLPGIDVRSFASSEVTDARVWARA